MTPVPDEISLEQYQKLTSLIFAAAIDESKWVNFLRVLSDISGGVYTHIFGHDLSTGLSLGNTLYQYQNDFVESYDAYYGNVNAWVPGFFEHNVGEIVHVQDMLALEDLHKTEFYQDWVKPQEDITGGGGAILHKDNSRMFIVGGNIRSKDSEKLEARWMRLLELITPNLRHAFELSRTLGGLRLEKAIAEQSFVSRETAVAVLNANGLIVYSNPLAQTMLESGTLVRLAPNGTFCFTERKFRNTLNQALSSLVIRDANVFASFPTHDEFADNSYVCSLTRFDPSSLDSAPLGANFGFSQPCLLLTLAKINRAPDIANILTSTFGLTPAEANVACLLTNGQTLQEIANQREVSLHTVRNQLKSAMSKTEKRRQVDLSKLIEQLRLYGRQV